jgi:hypothetical protein
MVEEIVPGREPQPMGAGGTRVPDGVGLLEVATQGPHSEVMLRINALALEHQQLLSAGGRSHRGRTRARQLASVEAELERLWHQRRVELKQYQ